MGLLKKLLTALICFYRRYISPLKKPSCRFYPTCSQYALDAVSAYGARKGGYMALRRILRCHPFNPGGYDPVRGRDLPAKSVHTGIVHTGKREFKENI